MTRSIFHDEGLHMYAESFEGLQRRSSCRWSLWIWNHNSFFHGISSLAPVVAKSRQVKSAPTPVGEPNVRAEAEKKIYACTNDCTTCRPLSKSAVAAFTWSRNVGRSEAKHPIEPHFSQQIPSCLKLCTCKTFPVLCPTFVVGAHGNDFLEVDSTQVLSAPSVRQVNVQCQKQISSIESYTCLPKKKFHAHGPSDPHAYSTRVKYHAIALANPCLVEAP